MFSAQIYQLCKNLFGSLVEPRKTELRACTSYGTANRYVLVCV
jgi:hypothetical protein